MNLFNSGKIEKYLVSEQEAFKLGKFKVYVIKRTEKGKMLQEYVIKASGGALKFTMDELQDLQKAMDKIQHLDYRWRQSAGLDY